MPDQTNVMYNPFWIPLRGGGVIFSELHYPYSKTISVTSELYSDCKPEGRYEGKEMKWDQQLGSLFTGVVINLHKENSLVT